MKSLLWILLMLAAIEQTVAENRTILPVDVKLKRGDHVTSNTLDMESSGFVDLSLLEFKSVDERSKVDTFIDIAIFAQKPGAPDPKGSGIGATTGRVCCSRDTLQKGKCTEDQLNRMIVRKDVFEGVLMTVTIPAQSTRNVSINDLDFDPLLFVEKRGTYSLLFANCHPNATTVVIQGATIWESLLTEEDVENSLPFYVALTCAYLVVLVWFGFLMVKNQYSRVELEYYIMATIILGFIATLLETIDYSLFAKNMPALSITTVFFDICKNGLSRIVLMMLSAGWTVTVATLERPFLIMYLSLGTVHMVLGFAFEVAKLLRVANVEEGDQDDDVSTLSTPIQYDAYILPWIDIFIWYLIFTGLSKTMQFLEENRQERKLERYKWLLRIMILAVLLNISAVLIVIAEITSNGDVDVAVLPEVSDVGFFLTLCCVAHLWRPNPNAREYAYAEELSADEDGVYDLELTENSPGVLPDGDGDSKSEREIT